MGVRCFLISETDRERRWLRRYVSGSDERCPGDPGRYSYHRAMVQIEDGPVKKDEEGHFLSPDASEYDGDPRWPTVCDKCQRSFSDDDPWQVLTRTIYVAEDGREMTLEDAEPGAMWDASWYPAPYRGADGKVLCVQLPNGRTWMIDSRASNCTKPDDTEHDCWCRHGDPPNLTVDKNPEPGRSTCEAGGGSIGSGEGEDYYHGFLRNGELVNA